jgi:thiol-disulfide isomerase/thioredoxin
MRKWWVMLLTGMGFALSPGVFAEGEASKAINFQFTDIAGKSVQLSDFRGRWVLVNFWAPWCPLCWVEVPALNELNRRSDFIVIGIGLDYGPDENIVRETAQRHNLDFHAIIAGGARRNPDSPFRQVGPVDFYPTSYLYDPNGEIVMFIPGQVKTNKVLAFMDGWNQKKNVLVAAGEGRRVPSPVAAPAAQPAAIPVRLSEPAIMAPIIPAAPIKDVAYVQKVEAKAKPTAVVKSKTAAKAKRTRTAIKKRKTVAY